MFTGDAHMVRVSDEVSALAVSGQFAAFIITKKCFLATFWLHIISAVMPTRLPGQKVHPIVLHRTSEGMFV